MIKTIKRGLSRLRDAVLSVFAQHILDSMTGNLNFTTPVPTLPTISTALADYNTALADAEDRDKQKVLVKNQRRTELKVLLNRLFDYVILTGAGNIEVLASSGFPLAKERTPVGDMPKPSNFKITLGDGSGEMHLRVNNIYGADLYVYQYTVANGPVSWVTVNDPSSRISLNGLVPGTQYIFRCAAVGAKGQGPWSDEISRFAA